MELERKVSFNGLECTYTINGKGKPILLIHGFCLTGSSWRHIEKGLDGYTIITPTLPGFKQNNIQGELDIPLLADLLYQVLLKESIEELVIFGHSMGGYIALEMIERYSHIKKGIGLIHSHPFADDPAKIKSRRKGINFLKKYGSGRYAKETIPYLFDDNFRTANHEIVQELIQEVGSVSESTISSYLEAIIKRPDQSEILKNANGPVLFILGEADNSLSLEQGLQQVVLPEIAILKILFGIGHLGIIEQPDEVITSIKKYLDFIKY